MRSRICQSIPANCPGNDFQTQPCNTNCAVSAGVTAAPSSANTTTSSVATVIDDFDTRAALALVLPEGPSAGARSMNIFFNICFVCPLIARKRSKLYNVLTCRPFVYHTEVGGIPLSVFANDTTTKLEACSPHCPFNAEQGSCEYQHKSLA